MSTPYSTPSFPPPPRPTPASAPSNRFHKAPIYNPYDKFTQTEFDVWIGGITGALRRALGQEENEEEQQSVTHDHVSDLFPPGETEQSSEYELESEAEDSFAEIKIRQDKGKGRDPREGPGLGGRLQPIEILHSDSDEEEGQGEEEIEDDDDEDDEEGEYDWREYDSDGNRYDEYEGSEEGYGEEASGHRINDDSPEDDIPSSEEEDRQSQGPFESEDVFKDTDGPSSPGPNANYTQSIADFGQPLPSPDEDEDALGDEESEYPEEEEGDEQVFPPRSSPSQAIDLVDPWAPIPEDIYSGGDVREGDLDPDIVSPSNLTPVVRARSEHAWEQDANGLLPTTPVTHKEPTIIDVDIDEDEKDQDLLPSSSPVASSPVEGYDLRRQEYITREGEYDENYVFGDDDTFDEFLGEEAGGERSDLLTPSPEILIAAQPQRTQLDSTPISNPVPHPVSSFSPAHGSNGYFNWNSPPPIPGNVTSGPGYIVMPPANGTPEIIELVDDDEDDENHGRNKDKDADDNAEVEQVEEPTSEDEYEYDPQVQSLGTTSDLIREVSEEDNVRTIDEPFAAKSYLEDDNPEGSGNAAISGHVEISADQHDTLTNGLDVICVNDYEEMATDEMHEVPGDVRLKASLLESFLANAEPTWDPTKSEQPPISHFAQVATVEGPTSHDSAGPSVVEAKSRDDIDVDDIEPHVESLADDDQACSEPVQLSHEGPDDPHPSNDVAQTTTGEAPGVTRVYYTVSEATDDVCSAVSPDERHADIVSVTDDHTGDSAPYLVEEPISEGGDTEEPADHDATDRSKEDLIPKQLDEEVPVVAIFEHTPEPAFVEIIQAEFDPSNDIGSTHRPPSSDAMPANAEEVLDSEPQVSTHNEETNIQCTFPMSISADPSVPDPAVISPDTQSNPPLTDLELSHDSAQASQVSPDSTETTVPMPATGTLPFSPASDSDLFTPQNEADTAPVSPNSQSAEPSVLDEYVRWIPTSTAEPERLLAEASSMTHDTTNAMDVSNDGAHDTVSPRAAAVQLDEESIRQQEEAKPLSAVEAEDDPFKLMRSDSKVAPGAVDDHLHSDIGKDERTSDLRRGDESLSNREIADAVASQVSEGQETTVTASSFYQNGVSLHSNGSHQTDGHEFIPGQSKPSKRKRTILPSVPARLTRSMSSKMSPSTDRKGKRKAIPDDDAASENGSSSSGASVASKLLRISRDTSRASSVVSTVQSAESSSFSVQPSPTIARQARSTNDQSSPPILYHVHSGRHHHHSKPLVVPQPLQIPKYPVASSSHSKDMSLPPSPSPSRRAAAVLHSPVTRSNCRFHRISLPREEGGPRVSFIVPGCSLGDRTLMIEEDIKDEGDATTLDHARMVDDIETLDFSSDLIGILRQLVGVDLLRENEIFFLPLPGESYRRKRHGKTKLYVARPPSGDLTLGLQSMATSPRGSATSKLPPNLSLAQTPVSGAGSPSTSTGSTGWNGREIDRYSPSAVSYSDDEAIQADDIGGSQTKRRKAIFSKENGVASSEEMPPPSLTVQTKSSPVRRRSKVKPIKRLSIDTHAYKPEPEAEGTSTDHDSDTTKQGKKSGRRGIKRNRTSEVVGADGGPEQPVTKRLRARLSTSANGGR